MQMLSNNDNECEELDDYITKTKYWLMQFEGLLDQLTVGKDFLEKTSEMGARQSTVRTLHPKPDKMKHS